MLRVSNPNLLDNLYCFAETRIRSELVHFKSKRTHLPFRSVYPLADCAYTTYNLFKNEECQLRDDAELHVFP